LRALRESRASTHRDARVAGAEGDAPGIPGVSICSAMSRQPTSRSSMVLFEIDPQRSAVLPFESDTPRAVQMDRITPWPEAPREAAIAAAGIERYRIWRLCMAGMARAFDGGWLSVVQVLALKPLPPRALVDAAISICPKGGRNARRLTRLRG